MFLFLQFMVLLVLRHTLPVIINGAGDYTISLFMVSIAGTVYFAERIVTPFQQQMFMSKKL